jgi:trehalose/maltose hydrolase-like predicted phosphorylase
MSDDNYKPLNPPREAGALGRALPAYVANGLVGLRVRDNPLRSGMAIVSGFTGRHHERHVEAAAAVPYPLGLDVAVDKLRASEQPERIEPVDQAYDFSRGELTTRIVFRGEDARLDISVLTFCSRSHPTIVCQQTEITASDACEVIWRGRIAPEDTRGRIEARRLDTPGEAEPACDGSMLWVSEGELSTCGLALLTEGPERAARDQEPWDQTGPLGTAWRLRLGAGQTARFRQMVSLVPSVMHDQPDMQAVRLLSQAKELGFDEIRRRNRDAWQDLWRGRIRLVGAEERWQALADAAFYYLNSSSHPASPASTSIFGLASWRDYHYYFGHVMWDIDAFALPPLALLQPAAARAMLDFRTRYLQAARDNAKMQGLPGLRFPWEAAPSTGQEATPGAATGAGREDHVGLHVALAFDRYATVTGDQRFRREQTWPVLAGVADWICARVTRRDGGFQWLGMGGPAERKEPVDNDALTLLLARSVLQRAAATAAELNLSGASIWSEVAEGLSPPMRSDGAVAGHDGHRIDEEQGAAPSPLLAIFPYGVDLGETVERKTLELYLAHWEDFVGAPMMAALYPAWAVRLGDRALALKLMDEGYGRYQSGRFAQTLEYRLDKVPDGVAAGPFFANIGGFLLTLLLGLPGLECGDGPPETWTRRPVVLPEGWRAIECDQLWIQGRPACLRAVHGADRAEIAWT